MAREAYIVEDLSRWPEPTTEHCLRTTWDERRMTRSPALGCAAALAFRPSLNSFGKIGGAGSEE